MSIQEPNLQGNSESSSMWKLRPHPLTIGNEWGGRISKRLGRCQAYNKSSTSIMLGSMQSPRGRGGGSGCRGGGDGGRARRIDDGVGASYARISVYGPSGRCGAEGPHLGHSNTGRDGNEDGGKREGAWEKCSSSVFGGGGSTEGGWSSTGASVVGRVQRKGEEKGGPYSKGAFKYM
uniref:Uncharacterized protein n=1 Tax=Nelumbo nucifera TaxID=4432 RepID=A0A822YBL2_NELNU|nr:TPA_asm: hypothetical protein HUJ06_029914 [Nelumbo nucifera]